MAYVGACEVCSGYWRMYEQTKRPVTIGKGAEFMAEVRRCRHCGAYWEVGVFGYPMVISRE